MNELEYQVRLIKQSVRNNDPKWLTLQLLDTLEGYVAGEPEAAQQSVQRTARRHQHLETEFDYICAGCGELVPTSRR